MSYSEPIFTTYRVLANGSLSTAATATSFIGPAGRKGRVVACEAYITTGTTTNSSTIKIHPNGGTSGSCLTMTVPVLSATAGHQATLAELAAGADLTADAVHDVVGGGEADAGAADITVTCAWF